MWQSLKITTRLLRAGMAATMIGGLISLSSEVAIAETLKQALASAYQNNPTLAAERASLRATDEQVPQALSGYRPTIRAEASTSFEYGDVSAQNSNPFSVNNFVDGVDEQQLWDYSITLEQSLFRGFRTTNTVKQAKARVKAAREQLKTQEQTILQRAVTAYVDVIRDLATLRLRRNNVRVLNKELQAVRDRFQLGSATKTDVAQARARRAGAKSQLALARSNLNASKAIYEQIIGHKAIGLRQPTLPVSLLPKTLDQAVEIGLAENPAILAAKYTQEASNYDIDIIRGELLPEITFEASYEREFSDRPLSRDEEEVRFLARLTMPLYAGGNISARERQAHQVDLANIDQINGTKRQVQQAIIEAWASLRSAKASLKSTLKAVEANRVALSGVRQEKDVGQRTLLDVLNAEQELLNSQVTLVQTRRGVAVATFGLLQAIGHLSVDKIGVPVKKYDPTYNYEKNKYKLLGLSIDTPAKPAKK